MPRLSVEFEDDVASALLELAAKRDVTVTEATRRAIAIYKMMDDLDRAGGRTRLIVDGKARDLLLY